MSLCARILVLEWKERAFIEKVKSRCFCWFPAAILVHQNGAPIWRLHTKLYKGAWNVSANNSETVGHKDLRFGQIVYILVFYNISFSWLLPRDGFQFIFLLRDNENDLSTAWFDYKMFSSAKEKKGVKYYHLEWTNLDFFWRMLFQSFYLSTLNEAECGHVSKKKYPIK